MATNTPHADVPVLQPQPAAPPIQQPQVNQLPPEPDPREIAASSMMPTVPANITSTSGALSTITAALGYNRFLPMTFSVSTYTPSFLLFSLVLSEIDRIMMHTYRFYQSCPEWHPLFSQLYYGIIFFIHIFRVRRTAQTITVDENNFLDWFETNYPLSSMPIAGPLKHFLQSITVAQGYDKYYGNVYPHCTDSWTGARANDYMPNSSRFRRNFPPLPLIMDMLNDLLEARTSFNKLDPAHWTDFYLPLTHAFSAAANARVFGYPGVINYHSLPATAMPTWYQATLNLGLPSRLTNATTGFTTIAEYLRFGTNGTEHSVWFPRVVQMMQRHAQFMKDSTSLAAIETRGLGAFLPIIKLSANPHLSLPNPAANAIISNVNAVPPQAAAANRAATPGRAQGFRVSRMTHFRISATSKFHALHLLAEQFSLLSSVNLDFNGLIEPEDQHVPHPDNAWMRSGPVWDLPDVKQHTEINVLGQITSFLAGAFHVDQRLTRS